MAGLNEFQIYICKTGGGNYNFSFLFRRFNIQRIAFTFSAIITETTFKL